MKILNKIAWFLLLVFSNSLYALDIDYSLIGKPAPAFELSAIFEKDRSSSK